MLADHHVLIPRVAVAPVGAKVLRPFQPAIPLVRGPELLREPRVLIPARGVEGVQRVEIGDYGGATQSIFARIAECTKVQVLEPCMREKFGAVQREALLRIVVFADKLNGVQHHVLHARHLDGALSIEAGAVHGRVYCTHAAVVKRRLRVLALGAHAIGVSRPLIIIRRRGHPRVLHRYLRCRGIVCRGRRRAISRREILQRALHARPRAEVH